MMLRRLRRTRHPGRPGASPAGPIPIPTASFEPPISLFRGLLETRKPIDFGMSNADHALTPSPRLAQNTAAASASTCLLILGMHRSGTSACARLCNLLEFILGRI